MYKVQRNIRLHRKCNTLTPSHERDAEVKNTSFIIWDSIRQKRRLFVIFSFCLFCILCLDTMLWCCLYLCVVPISKGLTANKVANDSLNVHSKIASKLVILSANDKAFVVFLSWLHYKLTIDLKSIEISLGFRNSKIPFWNKDLGHLLVCGGTRPLRLL